MRVLMLALVSLFFDVLTYSQVSNRWGEFGVPALKVVRAGHRKAGQIMIYSVAIKALSDFSVSSVQVKHVYLLLTDGKLKKGRNYQLEVFCRKREDMEIEGNEIEEWAVKLTEGDTETEVPLSVIYQQESIKGIVLTVKKNCKKQKIRFDEVKKNEVINAP